MLRGVRCPDSPNASTAASDARPYIHAGILADMTNPEHAKQLQEFGIKPFDP
ncbi:MAG: hypothetical protein ACLS6O_05175 [Bifidobacterium sp.]